MKSIATFAEFLGGVNPIGLAVTLFSRGIPINQYTGEYDETVLGSKGGASLILDIACAREKEEQTPEKKEEEEGTKEEEPAAEKIIDPWEEVENEFKNRQLANNSTSIYHQVKDNRGRDIKRIAPSAYENCSRKMQSALHNHGVIFMKDNKMMMDRKRNTGHFYLESNSHKRGIRSVITVSSSKYTSPPTTYVDTNTGTNIVVPPEEACRLAIRVPTQKINWEWCIAYITGWDKILLFKANCFAWEADYEKKKNHYTSKAIKESATEFFFDTNINLLIAELQALR